MTLLSETRKLSIDILKYSKDATFEKKLILQNKVDVYLKYAGIFLKAEKFNNIETKINSIIELSENYEVRFYQNSFSEKRKITRETLEQKIEDLINTIENV